MNELANGEYKLSVNDFVVKAAALAMKKVPEVNSSWMGEFIRRCVWVCVGVCVRVHVHVWVWVGGWVGVGMGVGGWVGGWVCVCMCVCACMCVRVSKYIDD